MAGEWLEGAMPLNPGKPMQRREQDLPGSFFRLNRHPLVLKPGGPIQGIAVPIRVA